MVKRLVAEEGLSVQGALETVDLAKSSYYYRSRKRNARSLDRSLVTAIEKVLLDNRRSTATGRSAVFCKHKQ